MSSYIQSMRDVKDALLNTQLKSVPLFNSFSDNQLDLLYKIGVIKRFEKGCIAIHQDSHGDTFYIVISGRAKVTLLNEDGKEIVLSTLKEGDFFGELSLLDDETT